jgi:very-short-patch-repair endonuclease
MAARLVIEVDGSQHGEEPRAILDEARTKWLESEGYKVLRFWNNDVFSNTDGVLNKIHAALSETNKVQLVLKHTRRRKSDHPTPARSARRPTPTRGG